MKSKSVNVFVVLSFLLLLIGSAFAQDFVRNADLEIPVPDADLNTGGMGNMVTDVDLDNDGRTDVYVVSHNWTDAESEMIFRLYKYEYNGSDWEVVWNAEVDVWKSNTWPALTIGDLDQDGKQELIAGPVNWTDADENPNPVRIVVFESAGDGSDVMGVASGEGYAPNTQWTIASEDNLNMRPFRWVTHDIDGDGTVEVVFAERYATTSGWYFGVISVDDVPDDADGSETWTLEGNGPALGLDTEYAENKWDLAILGDTIYLFDETQCDRVRWTGDGWELLEPQTSVLAGAGSWKSAQVLDIDGNAEQEIIVGTWYTTVEDGHGIYIYQYDAEGDSLVGTKVADLSPWMPSYGVYGSAVGDIDLNGKLDYVFGSRSADPEGAIFRMEYQGTQDDVANPDNWVVSVIDSGYADGGRWGILGMANVDSDPNKEVLYTSSVPTGDIFGTGPTPIVVLDNTAEVPTGPWQLTEIEGYNYLGTFGDTLGLVHGVVVDGQDRVWVGSLSSSAINVYNPDGTEAFGIDSVVTTTATGGDTIIYTTGCRGMDVDPDGNVIYAQSGAIMKFNGETGDLMEWTPFDGSPTKPAVDDAGYIYAGLVVGVTPVSVIDPATFEITQQVTLDPLAGGYARGMEVTDDGTRIIPGNLDNSTGHPLYIYETTDFVNYPLVDSLRYDNMGNPIFLAQTVTMDWDPQGRLAVSQDNSYGAGGADQLVNALVMFDFETMEYGYVWMPDPGASGYTGPRGAAWNSDGTKCYVGNWNGGVVYEYDVIVSVDDYEAVPNEFRLSQNYPNPFNPVTTINFRVADPGKVTLTVYNMLGQKVATLVNKNLPMGEFQVKFDGSQLASGQYIYELRSGDVTMTKKMMLIK